MPGRPGDVWDYDFRGSTTVVSTYVAYLRRKLAGHGPDVNVNPGADSFTVFLNGWLFVNRGAAITNGIGLMGCAG